MYSQCMKKSIKYVDTGKHFTHGIEEALNYIQTNSNKISDDYSCNIELNCILITQMKFYHKNL